jgi:hypothetical protein
MTLTTDTTIKDPPNEIRSAITTYNFSLREIRAVTRVLSMLSEVSDVIAIVTKELASDTDAVTSEPESTRAPLHAMCWSGLTLRPARRAVLEVLTYNVKDPIQPRNFCQKNRVTDPLSTLVLCGNVGWTITAKTKAGQSYPGGDVPSVCFMYHCNGHLRDSPKVHH